MRPLTPLTLCWFMVAVNGSLLAAGLQAVGQYTVYKADYLVSKKDSSYSRAMAPGLRCFSGSTERLCTFAEFLDHTVSPGASKNTYTKKQVHEITDPDFAVGRDYYTQSGQHGLVLDRNQLVTQATGSNLQSLMLRIGDVWYNIPDKASLPGYANMKATVQDTAEGAWNARRYEQATANLQEITRLLGSNPNIPKVETSGYAYGHLGTLQVFDRQKTFDTATSALYGKTPAKVNGAINNAENAVLNNKKTKQHAAGIAAVAAFRTNVC